MKKIVFALLMSFSLLFSNILKEKDLYDLKELCSDGYASYCFFLAEVYEKRKDFQMATDFYENACNLAGYPECNGFINLHKNTTKIKNSLVKDSVWHDQMACDLFQGEYYGRCTNLGILYESGKVVKRDLEKAAKLYKKGCDNDDSEACHHLGLLYENDDYSKKDLLKAVELYKKSCGVEYPFDGCVRLGQMYENGIGVEKNNKKALDLYMRVCEVHFDGYPCFLLAKMYDEGRGVEKDIKKAAFYYEESCGRMDYNGCLTLAKMYEFGRGVKKSMAEAEYNYERACDYGHNATCLMFASKGEMKISTEDDFMDTIKLYIKACEGGLKAGCEGVDRMYKNCEKTIDGMAVCASLAHMFKYNTDIEKDEEKAFELYSKTCRSGDKDGCFYVGIYYYLGETVEKDLKKAAEIFANLCDKKNREGCYWIGVMYLQNEVVEQDPIKAKEYYTKACKNFNFWCEELEDDAGKSSK